MTIDGTHPPHPSDYLGDEGQINQEMVDSFKKVFGYNPLTIEGLKDKLIFGTGGDLKQDKIYQDLWNQK